MNEQPKLCIHCRWYMPASYPDEPKKAAYYSRCGHDAAVKVTDRAMILVDGRELRADDHEFCSSQRISGCGPDGKNWEQAYSAMCEQAAKELEG